MLQGNEDVTLAEAELTGAGAPAALFCVFDGHCGRHAAEQAAQVSRPCGILVVDKLLSLCLVYGSWCQHGSQTTWLGRAACSGLSGMPVVLCCVL